jgi:hypothetical protein
MPANRKPSAQISMLVGIQADRIVTNDEVVDVMRQILDAIAALSDGGALGPVDRAFKSKHLVISSRGVTYSLNENSSDPHYYENGVHDIMTPEQRREANKEQCQEALKTIIKNATAALNDSHAGQRAILNGIRDTAQEALDAR